MRQPEGCVCGHAGLMRIPALPLILFSSIHSLAHFTKGFVAVLATCLCVSSLNFVFHVSKMGVII